MKRLHYNYLRPPFYFSRLLVFFLILSSLLSFQLIYFTSLKVADFLTIVIFLLLLLLCVGSLVEFRRKGDYMSPLEMYDVMGFVHDMLDSKRRGNNLDEYFLRYTLKSKTAHRALLSKTRFYVISTISKQGEYYEVTLLDQAKVLGFLFVKFLSKRATLHLRIRKIEGEFKVVSLRL